jgi:hypothetical protein
MSLAAQLRIALLAPSVLLQPIRLRDAQPEISWLQLVALEFCKRTCRAASAISLRTRKRRQIAGSTSMKKETPCRRTGVDAIGQTFKVNIALCEFSDEVDEALDAAPKTIEFPNDEHIAAAQGIQNLSEARPLRMHRAQVIFVNSLAAGVLESLALKSEVLVLRGNANVSDQHAFSLFSKPVIESMNQEDQSRMIFENRKSLFHQGEGESPDSPRK